MIPQSREAETALIGSAIINPEILTELTVEPRFFHDIRHRNIWDAILSVGSNIVVLVEELDKRKQLEEVGGPAYLSQLISSVPTSLDAGQYAKIIEKHYRNREFIRIAEQLVKQAQGGDVDVAKFIDQLTKTERVEGKAEHVRHELSLLYDLAQERANNPKDIWGMRTGWSDFDRLTGGLHKQQTTIIAGVPESGKTLIAMQAAKQVAEFGHPVAVYEFEMDTGRLLARLVSAESGVRTRDIYTGRVKDWDSFNRAVEMIEGLPLYVSDAAGMTTAQLRADVARMKAQHGIELVVLDYLNLLQDTDGKDENANTSLKSRRFRQICREFDCHGITIQSLTKVGMDSLAVSLSGVKGPSDVTYDADNVFGMTKHETDPNVRRLVPLKMRDGDEARKPVEFVKVAGLPRFEQIARL